MPPRSHPGDRHNGASGSSAVAAGFAVVRFGLISEDDGPPEWREKIYACWCVRLVELYAPPGGLLFVQAGDVPARAAYCFFSVPLHGRADRFERSPSYMADTHTLPATMPVAGGRLSRATFNTLLQFVLILLQIIGPMSFPRDMVTVFTALLITWCKRSGAIATRACSPPFKQSGAALVS